jgi:hypothetical protein
MIKFKSIPLIIFLTSMLTFLLFNLLLGEQPANAQMIVSTVVRYCNRTPQAINDAIGFSPNFTASNWQILAPDKCGSRNIGSYRGRVVFFVNGYQPTPAFRKQVDAGNNCYTYAQNGRNLVLERGC